MTFKTFVAHVFHPHDDSVIGAIELSLVAHAVAIAKADTGLVGRIEAQIARANTDPTLTTGAAKRDFVVAAVAGDVLAIVADPSKALADVIDFTHELVQSVYDDAASTSAGVIASIIVAKAAPA